MEARAARLEKSDNYVVDAIADTLKDRQKRLTDKLERLEEDKTELDMQIAHMKLKAGMQLTEQDIRNWLNEFANYDANDEDFQK